MSAPLLTRVSSSLPSLFCNSSQKLTTLVIICRPLPSVGTECPFRLPDVLFVDSVIFGLELLILYHRSCFVFRSPSCVVLLLCSFSSLESVRGLTMWISSQRGRNWVAISWGRIPVPSSSALYRMLLRRPRHWWYIYLFWAFFPMFFVPQKVCSLISMIRRKLTRIKYIHMAFAINSINNT